MTSLVKAMRGAQFTVGHKILVILAVVAVPFILMTSLYLNQVQKDVSFGRLEAAGADYLALVWPVAAGAAAGSPDAGARQAEALRSRSPARDEPFRSAEAVDALVATATGHQSPAAVVDAAKAAIQKIADGSNLTLDPDLDSYYLMDTTTVRLPEFLASLITLRNAVAPYVAGGPAPSMRDFGVLSAALQRYETALANVQSSVGSAFDGNPDGSVAAALKPALERFGAAGAQVRSAAQGVVAAGEKNQPAVKGVSIDKDLRAALDSADALWSSARTDLVRLLDRRIEGFEHDRLVKMAGVSLALLLAGVILMLVIRSIRRPIRGLLGAIDRFQIGDYASPVPFTQSRTEFGQIARALKQLQGMGSQQKLTTAAIDGSSAMLMITDPDERIIYMSSALLQLFMELEPVFRAAKEDFSVKAMCGEHLDYYRANLNLRRELISDDGMRRRVRYDVGGRVINVDMSYIRSDENKLIGHTLLWNDITSDITGEAELSAVVDAAGKGDFSRRLDLAGKRGAARNIAEGLNTVSETIEIATREFSAALVAVAAGDLTRPVTGDFQGVFGELKSFINETIEKLSGTLQSIQSTASQVASAAQDIRSGAEDLAGRTEEQAASLEETAATTEELAASVKASAEAARRAESLAEEAMNVAAGGGKVVAEAVAAIGRIEAASRRISDIIAVIDDIAFQTNLLALNAAVESARAGEAGKGFAVVASEVRSLAQRSSAAAKDISGLIGTSSKEVTDGVRLVRSTGEALQQIVSASREVAAVVSEISSATSEQAIGIDGTSQTVAALDSTTQQNAALASQSAAAAATLAEQMDRLDALLGRFRTGTASDPVEARDLQTRLKRAFG